MKVLFISYDGLTDPLGQSQILPYICGLQEKGHRYSILSFEKIQRFSANQAAVKILLKRHNIPWQQQFYTKKPPVLSTIKDLTKMRQAIESHVLNNDCQTLHCRSYLSMYAAYPMAKKFGLKLIFDMRGFWIDERVEGGIWNLKNPIYSLIYSKLKRLERTWMSGSNLIISLTRKGKDTINREFTTAKNTEIHVIPCCADQSIFNREKVDRQETLELKSKLGIAEGEKVLVYSGSIGTWYMADEMMMQFSRMKDDSLVHKFLWLTLEDEGAIHLLADKHGVDRKSIIVKSSSRGEMPLHLSLADIGIFYILPTYSKVASSPTKLAELLLMGIPVICNNNVGDLDEFFSENFVGLCHDVSNLDAVNKDSLKKVLALNPLLVRNRALHSLSLEKGIEMYDRALKSLE